jgi:3-deoxy-D-manno-octulosonic-acid transferase
MTLALLMRLLYDTGIRLYYLGILLASPFHRKARQWIRGRKGLMDTIKSTVDPDLPLTWFHCSSLGEFEQGRPIMEGLRERDPGRKILLTFYSPSGYEIRKDYPGADFIFYLPLDTGRNAKKFFSLLNIRQAYFIKYEFWYHLLSGLKARNIPAYLVSGIFRKDQVYFRSWAKWFRKILDCFEHLFVQQPASLGLLADIGIQHVTLAGDTRFDRVAAILKGVKKDPRFVEFSSACPTVVAGSTWPPDEDILVRFINQTERQVKWIIAPHEIHESGINRLAGQIQKKVQRYTTLAEKHLSQTEVIIVDTIGILSSLYQYGRIAYIGGGFGKGIHNTLEAATFGLPVIVGPKYQKFQEAVDLVAAGAAFPIDDYAAFESVISGLLNDPQQLSRAGGAASSLVLANLGATETILDLTLGQGTSL